MSVVNYVKVATDYLFPGKCYKELVTKFNFSHREYFSFYPQDLKYESKNTSFYSRIVLDVTN